MTILRRFELESRKALVQCPKCLSTTVMDYYSALKRQETTDWCKSCMLAARNKTEAMTTQNYERIDNYVAEHNKETNPIYIIKFTDKRSRCLIRCNLCNTEQEIRYRPGVFSMKGCSSCVKKFAKRVYEHSEFYTPRLAAIYTTMVQRVTNPNRTTAKKYYQDKGISICQEWLDSRDAFYKWSQENGYAEDLTIDRIDSNKNYEPSNCRWVTKTTQARNTVKLRSSNTSGFRGVSKTAVGTWRARIKVKPDEVLIGVFNTAIEAALAYDNYILLHQLEHTRNFS